MNEETTKSSSIRINNFFFWKGKGILWHPEVRIIVQQSCWSIEDILQKKKRAMRPLLWLTFNYHLGNQKSKNNVIFLVLIHCFFACVVHWMMNFLNFFHSNFSLHSASFNLILPIFHFLEMLFFLTSYPKRKHSMRPSNVRGKTTHRNGTNLILFYWWKEWIWYSSILFIGCVWIIFLRTLFTKLILTKIQFEQYKLLCYPHNFIGE